MKATATYQNSAPLRPSGSRLVDNWEGTQGNTLTVKGYGEMVEPFWGPPSRKLDDDQSMRYPHEAYFLQDAYAGRNDYIRQTIVYAVVNQNSFMTRVILPWRHQENPNIAWEKVQFNRTLADLEPEQGVPRYVTVEKEKHSDAMVRRGLALIVNHGFAATPGGQSDWAWKLATIAGAMQETCDQDGLLALLACKDQYQTFRDTAVEQLEMADDAKRVAVEDRELFRFGVVQREDRGWIALDAEAEYEMRLQHVQPNSWIVPPRMLNFVALGQKAETEYYRAGDEARANLRQGGDNFASFRGKKVFETKPYSLDVDGRVLDPLTRERMIGDYFVEPIYDDTVKTSFYCCESDRFEERKQIVTQTNGQNNDNHDNAGQSCDNQLQDNDFVDHDLTGDDGVDAEQIVQLLQTYATAEEDHMCAWWAYNMSHEHVGMKNTFAMVRRWFEDYRHHMVESSTPYLQFGQLHAEIKDKVSTWHTKNKGVHSNDASPEVTRCIVACGAIALQDPNETSSSARTRTVPTCEFSDEERTLLDHIDERSLLYTRIRVIHALIQLRHVKEKVKSTDRLDKIIRELKEKDVCETADPAVEEPLILLCLWSLCGIARNTNVDLKKRYQVNVGNQLLVPWKKNELQAEVACLEADLRFTFMAPSPLPTSEDALAYFVQSTKGVVEQFATQSGFDKGQIALFESFVRRDSRDSTSALDKVAALEGSEGYILDMLLVRVLQIKLKNVLAEDEIALLDKDVDLTSDTEDVPLYIGVLCKVGVYFSEHFNLTADDQALFKNINHICPLSVTVARAWLIVNTTTGERPEARLRGLCAKMIMKCMDCTLKMHEIFDEVFNLKTGKERTERLDQHFEKNLQNLRMSCGLTKPISCSAEEPNVKLYELEQVTELDPLLLELRDTALADTWVDQQLLNWQGRDSRMPHDNLLKVRTMLENRLEALDYHDWEKTQLTVARGAITVEEVEEVRLLYTEDWKGGKGTKRDHWLKGNARIWSRVPAWILAQGITERGSSGTSNLFSVVPVLLASATEYVALSQYYLGTKLVTNMFVESDRLSLSNASPLTRRAKQNSKKQQLWLYDQLKERARELYKDLRERTTMNLVSVLKSANNDDSLHTAVREITIDRLVQQGGYARPYTSWAKELNPTQHKELKYHPLVLELLLQRLTDSFITQYNEFSTGEAKDEEAKLAAITSSVMSLTGGPNSPFERRRAITVTLLDAELDRVHAPLIVASVSASRRASDRMARMQLAEESRGMAIETPECEYSGEPFEQISPVAYEPPPTNGEVKLRLCFRPFRRYRMGTGILCQAGEALGNTFRGHEDFQMTDNIIAKTHIGHYTMWHKAVVVDDRRLYLAEDMFCSGYVGGEGHKSVDITTVLAQEDKFLEDPIQWMEQSDGGNGASIITIDVAFPEKTTMSSMPRSFYLENFSKQLQVLRGKCTKVADASDVDELFQKLNSPEDEAAKENYLTDMGGINTVCFRTMEISTDRADGKQSIRTLNQGHFGVNGTYEGARRPRSGYIETFKDCKYEQHLLKNH